MWKADKKELITTEVTEPNKWKAFLSHKCTVVFKFFWRGNMGLRGVLYFHILLHFYDSIFQSLLRGYMRCPPPTPRAHLWIELTPVSTGLYLNGQVDDSPQSDQISFGMINDRCARVFLPRFVFGLGLIRSGFIRSWFGLVGFVFSEQSFLDGLVLGLVCHEVRVRFENVQNIIAEK